MLKTYRYRLYEKHYSNLDWLRGEYRVWYELWDSVGEPYESKNALPDGELVLTVTALDSQTILGIVQKCSEHIPSLVHQVGNKSFREAQRA